MAHLVDGLAVHARIFTPHGATPTLSGWSWFPDAHKSSEDEFEAGLRSATDSLVQQIADVERKQPGCGRPDRRRLLAGRLPVVSRSRRARRRSSASRLPISGYLPAPLRATTKPADAPTVTALHGEHEPARRPRVGIARRATTSASSASRPPCGPTRAWAMRSRRT